ncbi:6-phosphofructokinase [Cutibacterium acnes HL007PA1]|nr:6-phosphofructokinase [Cutibacterium acnes HL007PA1]
MDVDDEMRLTPTLPDGHGLRIGILTSGGDAQGMNAAVRAVVRSALSVGAEVYAIYEGYQGMIDGGDGIRRFGWDDVGSILNRGGTVIGTFRCKGMRERPGRLKAVRNLLEHGIDRLVVIGGDGSLTGLDVLRTEWTDLVAELVDTGQVSAEVAREHPALMIAGLVGSIDNDLVGSDMTIGADTALHRIVDAIDDLASTAASHQRSFVVEVMGRHCGYLALMAAVAGGADYVLIPERPPEDGWEDRMCAELKRGRQAGRRDSIVVVAEGATDRSGNRISSEYVRQVLEDKLGEDARVTILGHVQRGGRPSAYDRWASTWLGYHAVHEVLSTTPEAEGRVIGTGSNRIHRLPLVKAVADTKSVPGLITEGRYNEAMRMRGRSFVEMDAIFTELSEPARTTSDTAGDADRKRVAIMHAGGPAPGMNTAARAAVRLAISRGHTVVGIHNGFIGLATGDMSELAWSDVEGWAGEGGAELGTRREIPSTRDLYAVSRALEDHHIDALLVIGGYSAYEGIYTMMTERDRYPAFRIPTVCIPASIDNNLPGSELSIGTDTALNVIVEAMDKIKESGIASRRCFVVETMGRDCGYLALMSGIAAGAERIYTNEDGISLDDLANDVHWLRESFAHGRRLFLAVRNENASHNYTTDFIARLLEEESHGMYDVRQVVLGHMQQGGSPSPFDRLLANRLGYRALNLIDDELAAHQDGSWFIGVNESGMRPCSMDTMPSLIDAAHRRPREQWWLQLRTIARMVSDEVR